MDQAGRLLRDREIARETQMHPFGCAGYRSDAGHETRSPGGEGTREVNRSHLRAALREVHLCLAVVVVEEGVERG
jgi:hypothetical protein